MWKIAKKNEWPALKCAYYMKFCFIRYSLSKNERSCINYNIKGRISYSCNTIHKSGKRDFLMKAYFFNLQ